MKPIHWFHVEYYTGAFLVRTIVEDVTVAAHTTDEAMAEANRLRPHLAADHTIRCFARRGPQLTRSEAWSERKRGDVS